LRARTVCAGTSPSRGTASAFPGGTAAFQEGEPRCIAQPIVDGPDDSHLFENQASEEGLFGGIVNKSVCPELLARFRSSQG
jgi:hypothetical protein